MSGMLKWVAAISVAAGVLCVADAAQAAWYRAETDRFVVYGEGREAKVRDYAAKLTTFDWVLRLYHPETMDRKASTKVVLYMVDRRSDIRKVRPGMPPQIAGFYTAMNEGVFAVASMEDGIGADDVIFHEYAHHFMLENFPAAYPAWFVEGFAEYFMTTDITPSQIKIGGYNPGRVYAIFNRPWTPLQDVLTKSPWQIPRSEVDSYYAESWLLMHYLRSDPKRARQLDSAARAIAAGAEPVKALQDATGEDLAQITRELHAYRKLPILMIKGPRAEVTSGITVTAMPKSADDLILDNLRLILSSTGRVDGEFLDDVRRKAAKYPGDAFAETTLARAEFVMGDVAAGEAIMQRRLAAEPNNREDLLLAATGQLMAGMRDRTQRDARWKGARATLAKAYALDKGDFRVLYAYALSRSIESAFPTDNDVEALLQARDLAPAVMENSFRAGLALIRKGRRDDAARVLAPVINNPHGGRAAEQARALLQGMKPPEAVTVSADSDDEPDPPAPPPAK